MPNSAYTYTAITGNSFSYSVWDDIATSYGTFALNNHFSFSQRNCFVPKKKRDYTYGELLLKLEENEKCI